MGISISKDKQNISISFYRIDYDKILSLLNLLRIDKISIFIDKGNEYCFSNYISTNEFLEYAIKLNQSLLIFDSMVNECFVDKEIEILSNNKMLIEINSGEDYVSILINRTNTNISIEDIKKII